MLRKFLLVAALFPIAPPMVDACPVCDRETGRQVRAGIFDESFGFNLLATALPFGVFLGVATAIHFGFPGAPAPDDRPADDSGFPGESS